MAVCDICSTPGFGTVISAEDMRQAVFKKGFNPASLGLVRDPIALMNQSEWYNGWKNTIVAQDTSDWNICPNCMSKLKSYLKGTPKPTGVTKATVSADPTVSKMAGAAAEQKYMSSGETTVPKSRLGWVLTISGVIILVGSLCTFAPLVAMWSDSDAARAFDPAQDLTPLVICCLPIFLIGFVLLLIGIRRLRSQRK